MRTAKPSSSSENFNELQTAGSSSMTTMSGASTVDSLRGVAIIRGSKKNALFLELNIIERPGLALIWVNPRTER
jgi:hypothetical protein